MPTTLTLKNIPDALYGRLKEAANAHRRSLNSKVTVCLEAILLPQKISVDERLARARKIRQALADVTFSVQDIARCRGEDRRDRDGHQHPGLTVFARRLHAAGVSAARRAGIRNGFLRRARAGA